MITQFKTNYADTDATNFHFGSTTARTTENKKVNKMTYWLIS